MTTFAINAYVGAISAEYFSFLSGAPMFFGDAAVNDVVWAGDAGVLIKGGLGRDLLFGDAQGDIPTSKSGMIAKAATH